MVWLLFCLWKYMYNWHKTQFLELYWELDALILLLSYSNLAKTLNIPGFIDVIEHLFFNRPFTNYKGTVNPFYRNMHTQFYSKIVISYQDISDFLQASVFLPWFLLPIRSLPHHSTNLGDGMPCQKIICLRPFTPFPNTGAFESWVSRHNGRVSYSAGRGKCGYGIRPGYSVTRCCTVSQFSVLYLLKNHWCFLFPSLIYQIYELPVTFQ